MRDDKKQTYSLPDKVAYRMAMCKNGISKYKPITLFKKCVAWGLIGYGVATFVLPSGSQLALACGCGLLGIPFSKVWAKVKLYSGRVWYCVRVLCSKRRVYSELKMLRMRVFKW